jgi:hypothetical protein
MALNMLAWMDATEVLGIMNKFMHYCGGTVVGSTGYATSQGPAALEPATEKARELGRELVKAIQEKRQYPEQEAVHQAMRQRFKHLILANKEVFKHNYDHFVERGWIKA